MKPSQFFSGLLLLASAAASAQGLVVGPAMTGATTLNLYDGPDAAAPVRQVALRDVALPLSIEEKQPGALRVMVDDKQYWVRSVEVRTTRGVNAKCGAIVQASSTQSAATPGAGTRACK